ncbi:3-phosphoshikimate 1-carboxyvinyltransferase, partial [Streptomyces sp. SP17BM10]|nr:3-phosphoshikimate 1-carboxyvinyltransferase [Streptomyces sp. SP17BM10]
VSAGGSGGLPRRVDADGLRGGELTVDGRHSSQFLCGMLMAAPLLRTPLTVTVRDLGSRPYVDLTIELMRLVGASVTEVDPGVIGIGTGGYTATDLAVEPDASTASYVFAA